MIKFFYFLSLLIIGSQANAHTAKFISAGEIEFERKINLFNLYSSQPVRLIELKKNKKQFRSDSFTLRFDSSRTVYQPKNVNVENNIFSNIPADKNFVYSNLESKIRKSHKNIFGDLVVILDTIEKIRWKMTDERRIIAGLECKRANCILLDSIYVVVFFSEEILTCGGPESFSGLPGMILGVAVPALHLSWFATRLSAGQFIAMDRNDLKGEAISNIDFKKKLQSEYKRLGDIGNWFFQFSLL